MSTGDEPAPAPCATHESEEPTPGMIVAARSPHADEYGRIEYGELPVESCASVIVVSHSMIRQLSGSRPKAGVNGAGHRFCFETHQVIEERTYARACTSIAD